MRLSGMMPFFKFVTILGVVHMLGRCLSDVVLIVDVHMVPIFVSLCISLMVTTFCVLLIFGVVPDSDIVPIFCPYFRMVPFSYRFAKFEASCLIQYNPISWWSVYSVLVPVTYF